MSKIVSPQISAGSGTFSFARTASSALFRASMRAYSTLVDLVFPVAPLVCEIEAMTAEKFSEMVPKPEPIANATTDTLSDGAADSVTCLFSYQSEHAKAAIHQLKYGKNRKIATLLAECLAKHLGTLDISSTSPTSPTLPIILIPAPISSRRRRERGYNQIEFLLEQLNAHNLGEKSPCFEIRKDILRKIRHTAAQSKTESREERLANLKNCFALSEKVAEKGALKDRHILIIDDVYTTGTTMQQMIAAFRDSGALSVSGICLAH